MRMLLMFDLPTETSDDRKVYRRFRKFLLSEGFIMHQFSVYSKLLLNGTANQAMLGRLKAHHPKKGLVTLLTVTENNFHEWFICVGKKT